LQRLYVDARWHGTGVARDLMDALLAIAEAGGADAVWLGVWAQNPRARGFYRKFGFADAGEHAFRFGDEIQTDVVMVRPVSPRASFRRSR
jgi:ribosomal protein S18 acetylase RimI-like enzyme